MTTYAQWLSGRGFSARGVGNVLVKIQRSAGVEVVQLSEDEFAAKKAEILSRL